MPDDSRFFEVHHDVPDAERMDHDPSPAPDDADRSEPAEHEDPEVGP